MKSLKKNIFSIAAAMLLMLCCSFTAFADDEVEDYEFNVSKAKMTSSWGQSISFGQNEFNCSRFTEDTIITVEFELDGTSTIALGPIELILQNYTTANPQIWAKIAPFEFDETSASFSYEDMIAVYGLDDLSGVDTLCFGDTGTPMLVTKAVATNCKVPPAVTTVTTKATTEKITEPDAADEPAVTTAATDNPNIIQTTTEEDLPIGLIIAVVAIVVVVVVVIVVISARKKRGKFY